MYRFRYTACWLWTMGHMIPDLLNVAKEDPQEGQVGCCREGERAIQRGFSWGRSSPMGCAQNRL